MTTATDLEPMQLDQLAINRVRFLSVDAIERARIVIGASLWC